MTSTTSGVRFVKCPKCLEVLMEFTEVPVYQCRGCGTVLRAKIRGAATEKTVGGSLENNSQDLMESSSLVKESISFAKSSNSLEVNNGVEKVAESDHHIPISNTECDSHWKEESPEHRENGTEERRSEDLRRDGINVLVENHPEEIIQVRKELCVDKETENPLLRITEGANSHSLSEKMEKSSKSFRDDAAISAEDVKLTSQAYYNGSVSSRDEEPENQVPLKYRLLSKRTFGRKKVSSVDDSSEKETYPQTQKLPIELSNERFASDTKNSIAPSGDGLPRSHIKPQLLERDTTFGSEDFHSVQNWMGSEIGNGDSSSLSKDILFQRQSLKDPSAKLSTKVNSLESGRVKILRKVDELRDELNEFLTETVEGKGVSNFKPRHTQFPLLEKPTCSCLAGSHSNCCHSNLASRLPKVPVQEDETEKNSKAKKQAIKQHYRPVYGGAPFVICYKCWTLLQLPADFLVRRKRLHKLQCGACSEVLVFSFRPKVHTASHTPNGVQPPPGEVDHKDGYIIGDSISHSDSYSSEAGPVLNVSRSSSYSIQGRESKKLNDSRLHLLMGYSSASELLFRTGHDDEGYQSIEPRTPHFYRPPKDEYMRYGQYGTGTNTPKSTEIEEEDEESHEKESTWTRGSTLPGLLKKGVQEFSLGYKSIKLKIHSKG